MSKEERLAYEKEHGFPPPGYRATGAVGWFAKRHDDFGPCVVCGTMTDRWEIGNTYIGTVSDPPSPTYHNHALCGDMIPRCWPCERARAIAMLIQRQGNMAIDEACRAGEAKYLAELQSEIHEAAA